jgi:hypothetical protein
MIRHIPIVNMDNQIKVILANKVDQITHLFQQSQNKSYEGVKSLLKEIDDTIFTAYSISDDEKQAIISDIKSRIKHFENIYA